MPPRSILSTSESRLRGRCIRYGMRLTSRAKRQINATAASIALDVVRIVIGGAEMHNKLSDLNNHLFAELERLGDESLEGDALTNEIERAKAISSVSSQIVSNATLLLKAVELQCEYGDKNIGLNGLLELEDKG